MRAKVFEFLRIRVEKGTLNLQAIASYTGAEVDNFTVVKGHGFPTDPTHPPEATKPNLPPPTNAPRLSPRLLLPPHRPRPPRHVGRYPPG